MLALMSHFYMGNTWLWLGSTSHATNVSETKALMPVQQNVHSRNVSVTKCLCGKMSAALMSVKKMFIAQMPARQNAYSTNVYVTKCQWPKILT
jgi:hypothetical protein